MMHITHPRPGPSVLTADEAEMDELSARVRAAWPDRQPEAVWGPLPPVIDDEFDALKEAVATALSPRTAGEVDLNDVVFRLSRVEDALAGLKAGQVQIVNRMITFVCFAIGARPTELMSERRSRHLAHGRFAIMWGATKLTTYSLPRIASALGGFDHTSVIHGIRRADALRVSDPDFRSLTDAMLAHFTADEEPDRPPLLPFTMGGTDDQAR